MKWEEGERKDTQGTSSGLLNWQQQGWESRNEGIGCKGSRAYVNGRKTSLRCKGVGRWAQIWAVSSFRVIARDGVRVSEK